MGASVQKDKAMEYEFQQLEFKNIQPYLQQKTTLQNTINPQFQRQDSTKSFQEITVARNQRNVINDYDLQPDVKKQQESVKKKELGNRYFEQKKYQKAIEAYSEAIKLNNLESLNYSNRAIAYKTIGKIEEAVKDCEIALQLNGENIRALVLYGTAMVMKSRFSKSDDLNEQTLDTCVNGIKYLEKADQLLGQSDQKGKAKLKHLTKSNLAKAKRILFLLAKILDDRNCQSLIKLIDIMKKRSDVSVKFDMEFLKSVVESNKLKDVRVPDYFICPISQDIMNDPLLTETGQTYDKESLTTQFKTNGCIDPVTRAPLNPQNVVYNQNIRMGINDFKSKCGWLGTDQSEVTEYYKITLE